MHFRQIPSLCWKIADFRAFRPCGGHNKAKSRKYRGVFKVKSRVRTWQVSGIWSQQWCTSKSQQGWRNHVSGRASVPCWHATPVANAPWKPLIIRWSRSTQGCWFLLLLNIHKYTFSCSMWHESWLWKTGTDATEMQQQREALLRRILSVWAPGNGRKYTGRDEKLDLRVDVYRQVN